MVEALSTACLEELFRLQIRVFRIISGTKYRENCYYIIWLMFLQLYSTFTSKLINFLQFLWHQNKKKTIKFSGLSKSQNNIGSSSECLNIMNSYLFRGTYFNVVRLIPFLFSGFLSFRNYIISITIAFKFFFFWLLKYDHFYFV